MLPRELERLRRRQALDGWLLATMRDRFASFVFVFYFVLLVLVAFIVDGPH